MIDAISNNRNLASLRLALLGGAAGMALLAQSAHAQQGSQQGSSPPPTDTATPAPDDTTSDQNVIIVTGSRIARSPVTAQPATVLSADNIAKRGYTNLGTALQELPSFSVPSNSPIGSQGSFSAGQTFVNLYNLGSQRTLSLVNGHRFVTSSSASIFGPVAGSPVDFSSIPTNLVERTEVVSVGGAPIYGSDAIAGTVNVILKKDYEGVEVNLQSGISQRGDGANYTASLLAGKNFAEGRGNVTLSVQYDRQRGIPTSDRFDLGGDAPFFGSALSGQSFSQQLYFGGKRYNVFTNTGMPMFADGVPIYGGVPDTGITNAAGQPLRFDNSGHLVPFVNGQLTGNGLYQAGGDGFAIGDFDNFLTDSNRIMATMLARYDIADHIHFSGEAWYGRNTATNLRAQPFYNTGLFANAGDINGNLILSTDNPYLSAADRQTIINSLVANGQDPSTFQLARANTDLATGSFRTRTELYRFVGGLNGDFAVGSRTFNWEISALYGRAKTRTTTREVVNQNYYNALDAVTDGSGNIICRPGYTNAAIPTINSTCAPLDVFGLDQASPAALDYISAIADPTQTNTQFDVVADINGTVVHLPGGDMQFSLGYEHRRESTNFNPGAFYYGQVNPDGSRTQYGNSIPIDPVSGSYHTNEGFGELQIPVVSPDMNIPLVHSLNLQGAARYVDNSLTRGFWAWTLGGTYAPVADLTLRGNFTRSFRAPAITEAFAPVGQVFDTANDPCDGRYIAGGPNPDRRAANCAAAGIPAGFTSNVVDFTAQGTFGGNPDLENETANSWTVGGVFQPRFIHGLKLSVDYISIDVKNEIASLSLTDLMNACYDAVDFPNSPFCGTFTRDDNHQVTSFAEGNYNIGLERFEALQTSFDYQLPLDRIGLGSRSGSLGLTVNWLHTFNHYSRVGEGDKTISVGESGEPKDNVTANLNYYNGGFNFMWQTMYFGPTTIDANVPDTTYEYPKIGRYFMFNTSVGYDFDDKYSVRLIVNNIFNKGIPFPYDVSQTRYFDALMGRYFRLSFGAKL